MSYIKLQICINLILEIIVAVLVILFSYEYTKTLNIDEYETAKAYDKIKLVEIYKENNKLILHNISKSNNNIDLILKINKKQIMLNDNCVLVLDNIIYDLTKLNYYELENYYYYELKKINFEKYETLNYEHSIIINEENYLNYEFLIEII